MYVGSHRMHMNGYIHIIGGIDSQEMLLEENFYTLCVKFKIPRFNTDAKHINSLRRSRKLFGSVPIGSEKSLCDSFGETNYLRSPQQNWRIHILIQFTCHHILSFSCLILEFLRKDGYQGLTALVLSKIEQHSKA